MSRSLAEFAAGIACVVATDAAKCERRPFTACPPAGASPEVNEAVQLGGSSVSGQSVGIPLTIDTQRLGDLFIPAFRDDLRAVIEMKRLVSRAKVGSASHRARVRAFVHCEEALERVVELIRGRGGLLHCVVGVQS